MLGSLLRRVLPSWPEPVARPPNPFEPLGPRRQILLWCLGATDDPSKPTWFEPPKPGEDVFALFADYAAHVEPILLDGSDGPGGWYSSALLGALHLYTGRLDGADRILEALPSTWPETDHGAGRCLLLPMRALRGVLPLPEGFPPAETLVAGSPTATQLRAWLAMHRTHLLWVKAEARYRWA